MLEGSRWENKIIQALEHLLLWRKEILISKQTKLDQGLEKELQYTKVILFLFSSSSVQVPGNLIFSLSSAAESSRHLEVHFPGLPVNIF